ncbi:MULTISPECIES: hypothetical protein [Sphingomonas]|uniref:hypothetical protein n=1 Tax=Sphingomonas TaxID=13687 RepID=UPI000DEEBCDB|nr:MULTISPECIES: hypothetical protein [Sphingomonas]
MTRGLDRAALAARQEITAPPPALATPAEARAGCTDRNFGLPPALLLGVFGLFMAYLAVMWIGFAADGLVMPMVINVIFVAAFCVVPMKWATMKPAHRDRALGWAEFRERGIETLTGHSDAGEAATLVLLLPACVLFWGIATTTIAALV